MGEDTYFGGSSAFKEPTKNLLEPKQVVKMVDGIKTIGTIFELDVQDDDCLFKEETVKELKDGRYVESSKISGELNGIPFEMLKDKLYSESGELSETYLFLIDPNSVEFPKTILTAVRKHDLFRKNIFKKYSPLEDAQKWSQEKHMEVKFKELLKLYERMEEYAIVRKT